jgi:hypothetical protein
MEPAATIRQVWPLPAVENIEGSIAFYELKNPT